MRAEPILDLARLREPFPATDLEWRVQQCGTKNGRVWARVVAYVTARAIQDRLDLVCGPENWKNVFRAGPAAGVLCGLSIRIGGEWVGRGRAMMLSCPAYHGFGLACSGPNGREPLSSGGGRSAAERG